MLLNLSRIRVPHTALDEVYTPELFRTADDTYRVAELVKLHLDIYKTGQRFRLAGRVTTVLELPCSRCLEPFSWPVDASFDLVYNPRAMNSGEEEREIEEEDLATGFYDNDEIDLAQLMREQFYLALPMKPLCVEDCLGLCPICGTNLNNGTCDCRRDWEDPRLAALKALKRDS